jgi:hypothetical protein
VCILEFEEIDLVVTAFVLLLLHATPGTGMVIIISQCYGSSCQLAHAVMRLQYQSAGNGDVQTGETYGEEFLHLLQK